MRWGDSWNPFFCVVNTSGSWCHEALRGDIQLRTRRAFKSGQPLNMDMERKSVTYGLNGNYALIYVMLIQEASAESLPGNVRVMCHVRETVFLLYFSNSIKAVALGWPIVDCDIKSLSGGNIQDTNVGFVSWLRRQRCHVENTSNWIVTQNCLDI